MDNLRQKELLKYMSENVGISMEQAMKDLGYSDSYAKSSDKIKKTKGWGSLMRKYLPDRSLVKTIKEGLNANRVVSANVIVKKNRPTSQADGELPLADSRTNDFIEVPDHPTRHKFVETALKIKGKLVDKYEGEFTIKNITITRKP